MHAQISMRCVILPDCNDALSQYCRPTEKPHLTPRMIHWYEEIHRRVAVDIQMKFTALSTNFLACRFCTYHNSSQHSCSIEWIKLLISLISSMYFMMDVESCFPRYLILSLLQFRSSQLPLLTDYPSHWELKDGSMLKRLPPSLAPYWLHSELRGKAKCGWRKLGNFRMSVSLGLIAYLRWRIDSDKAACFDHSPAYFTW